jgi:hypothetical protein
MAATVQISFPLTPAGLDQGRAEVDQVAELFARSQKKPVASAKHPARRLFQRSSGRRSREILDLLPAGKEAAMTPTELARTMAQWPDGAKLSKASARAAIRNVQRAETHLLAEGLIDRRVIEIDFSGYDRESAGRYYVSAEDRKVLNRLFERSTA